MSHMLVSSDNSDGEEYFPFKKIRKGHFTVFSSAVYPLGVISMK